MSLRLLIALCVSGLLHAILVFNLTSFNRTNGIELHSSKSSDLTSLNTPVLQVGFLVLSQRKKLPNSEDIAPVEKQFPSTPSKNSSENTYKLTQNNHSDDVSHIQPNNITSIAIVSHASYLKPSDVDISAIPLQGIKPPAITFVNTLPKTYKVRIFINKNGAVDQVLNLSESDTTQTGYTDIEEQVRKLTFIPAKKVGDAVDSYIDIALEF